LPSRARLQVSRGIFLRSGVVTTLSGSSLAACLERREYERGVTGPTAPILCGFEGVARWGLFDQIFDRKLRTLVSARSLRLWGTRLETFSSNPRVGGARGK